MVYGGMLQEIFIDIEHEIRFGHFHTIILRSGVCVCACMCMSFHEHSNRIIILSFVNAVVCLRINVVCRFHRTIYVFSFVSFPFIVYEPSALPSLKQKHIKKKNKRRFWRSSSHLILTWIEHKKEANLV